MVEIDHLFDFDNVVVIDHSWFKGKILMKEDLCSAPQSLHCCGTLPVPYQVIQARTYHRREPRVQDSDQPGARADPPTDEAAMQEPPSLGPIIRA